MCNRCSRDPRDAIGEADRALFGLRVLLSELPPDADVPASGIGPLLALIHDRMEGAADQVQDYVPRNHPLAI